MSREKEFRVIVEGVGVSWVFFFSEKIYFKIKMERRYLGL